MADSACRAYTLAVHEPTKGESASKRMRAAFSFPLTLSRAPTPQIRVTTRSEGERAITPTCNNMSLGMRADITLEI
eukprot:CAMPEP_0183343260 /NCGR_PEP_ID=MMETSP0164_2-20130417/9213_1 /TAXON_ID=221442 /ORGANISM="Coccolithus pelagicus ssp braarudi, Strain PLY182g" /LENGTH=75 /DNA_ID=CAMNT_0025514039 /DNA_START=608 /DNA_END=832 /DNA_ORIENTATION=+